MNKPTIYTIIITYNRLAMLKRCLSSLFKQTYPIKKIIVVDNNSTDGTQKYLIGLSKKHKNLHPIFNNVNLGLANGVNTALKKIWKENWHAVWISDDDNIANNEALKNLIKFYDYKTILNSTLYDKKNKNKFAFPLIDTFSGIIYLNKNELKRIKNGFLNGLLPFNFTLVPKYVFQKCGLLDEGFFIRGEEFDFTTRLILNNFKIKIILNSYAFCLNKRNIKKIKFLNLKIYREMIDYVKNYYFIRNTLFLLKNYQKKIFFSGKKNIIYNFYPYYKYPLFIFIPFYFLYTLILFLIFYNKNKIKIIYSTLLAYYHFFMNKRGKYQL